MLLLHRKTFEFLPFDMNLLCRLVELHTQLAPFFTQVVALTNEQTIFSHGSSTSRRCLALNLFQRFLERRDSLLHVVALSPYLTRRFTSSATSYATHIIGVVLLAVVTQIISLRTLACTGF